MKFLKIVRNRSKSALKIHFHRITACFFQLECDTGPFRSSHSRTLTTGKLDSTPHERCPASPPRRSGESLPEADCLQSVSGNSRVLDTLDAKLQVPANFKSGCSSRAFEQLESGARHSQLLHLDVQLKAVPGSSVTTWSITGVCCTSPHSPATPSHSLRPSLADGCS